MKKTYKILLATAATIAVLVIVVAIAISPMAKNYIEKHDHELLGRSIRMDHLRMNIFTGRLRIENLRVGDVADSAQFFRLDSFDMRMRLLPLLGHSVRIKQLHFTAPDLKLYQRDTAFNFDDLIDRFFSDTTTVDDTPSTPWKIAIDDIRIRRGHVFYKDMVLLATWGMKDINLVIPGIYFGGEKTDVGAMLNFAEGGSLATQLTYDIDRSTFDIGVKLRNLTLPGMLPYFQQSLNVSDVDGRLSADMRLKGDTRHLLSVHANGTASLADFHLTDNQQRIVAGIDSLNIDLAEGDFGKGVFHFNRIYTSGLSGLLEISADGNSLTDLLKSDATAVADTVSVASTASSETLTIADLEIERGSIRLRDLTLEQPFEYLVSDIRMHSRDFNPSTPNNLTVDARMQKTGEVKMRWEGTLDDLSNQNLTIILSNVNLSDFSPYCEHYTAYPLTHGNVSFRSQNIIRNRYLNGTNHIDMFEPKVEKKRKDIKPEMHIPLKLGLYVLKDKKGHVEMDLPVKGSLDSPEFSYRKIVLKAIGNVLLKVVTAPFSFLSGNKDNLEYINVQPSQFVFSSEQYASFDKIADMLKEKPEMHLTLTQRINLGAAVPEQAANVLRMEYAAHLRSVDSVASGNHPRMSLLEYEKIQQTDIRTAGIIAFADSLLAARGTSPQGLSADEKAVRLYREQATGQLRRMMQRRDETLSTYMQTTHGLSAPVFAIQKMDSTALNTYKGRDRYTFAVEMDGENVDVTSDDISATDATATDSADSPTAAAH